MQLQILTLKSKGTYEPTKIHGTRYVTAYKCI